MLNFYSMFFMLVIGNWNGNSHYFAMQYIPIILYLILDTLLSQGSSNLVLEGNHHVEFSSSPN